jgi:hypothetical protein
VAEDPPGRLTLKGLKYGFLNDVSDTGMDNSTDRRRSNGTDFLRSAVQSNYSRKALEKVDVFTGIVCAVGEKMPICAQNANNVLAEYSSEWDPGQKEHTKNVPVYRVYIPEIECRPAPTSWADPVIATYYDVYTVITLKDTPEVGSVVTVRFDNINNFKGPRIIEVGKVIEFLNDVPGDLAGAFGGGAGGGSLGAYGGDAGAAATWASTSVSPLITDARCYDDAQDIPNKSQHASILADVHPDFLPHVKSFICEAWKQKQITIRLNSSYRSIERQQRLYDDWVAGGRTGIAPANPATGLSYHNLGMAIDFNPTLANGTRLMSTSSKSSWRSSGIVEIGKAAGMYWGGDFNSNFDPIHFDFRTRVSRGSRPAVLTAANSQGVSPNRANLDGIIT